MCRSCILVKNPKYGITGQKAVIPVPCGKCNQCIAKRITEWQWRILQELKAAVHSPFFVTFTYRNSSLPRAKVEVNGKMRKFGVLRERDMQLYWKLLRRHWERDGNKSKIRYFYVGEYGTLRRRPHYHAIIWNCDDIRKIIDLWPHGFVHISPMRSIDSVGYCLGYLYKGSWSPSGYPSFSRMSRGIGSNYLTPEVIRYHNRRVDNCRVSFDDGREIMMPKFFKEKIYGERMRRKVTQYLQEYADTRLDEKVKSVMLCTGKSEAQVLHEFYVEPFIEKKRVKSFVH